MGGAYLLVEPLTGVQVVIDAVHAGGLETLGLLRREESWRDTDPEFVLLFDLRNGFLNSREFLFERAPPCGDNAIGSRIALGSDTGSGEEFVLVN